ATPTSSSWPVEPVETQPIDSGVHSAFTRAQAGVCRKLAERRDLRKETCSSVLTVRTRRGEVEGTRRAYGEGGRGLRRVGGVRSQARAQTRADGAALRLTRL